MAFVDFERPSSTLSIDRKPSAFFSDDNATLDSGILDTPIMMSPTNTTSGLFSPEAGFWEDNYSSTTFPDRTAHVSTHSFFDQQSNNNNPFMRMPATQAATYGQQPSAWPMSESTSESRTPTASSLEVFGQEFESGTAFIPAASNPPSAFGGLPMHNNVRPSSVFPPTQQEDMPMSPHSNQDWMNLAAQEREQQQRQGGPMRKRAQSPPRFSSPFPRRDGIRKKNARFDIPAERNLVTIDQLIAQSTNEEEIKELKQQKRLLRNRQAALDSRQRKKKHTEELEEEKKIWTERVAVLEDDLNAMRMQMENLMREKEQLHHQQLEAQQIIDNLQWDKEELVRTHTIETGELRKKVSVLTEKLETTSTAMSVAPSSASFNDFASDMNNLHMGTNEWDVDNYVFIDDFCMDQQPQQPQPQPENALVVAARKKETVSDDKPVASGLLLMLLLCGAFVASKSSGTGPAPPLPRMPDEVRAASATVLDSIFKDAGVGVPPSSPTTLIANHVQALEPAPSGVSWPKPTTLSGAEFASISNGPSSLDQQFSQLVNPSKDQEIEQAFSMTASQYNSLTSTEFTRRGYADDSSEPMSPASQPSGHRRNLAETLAAMRDENKGESAAEVYTRSLLWERIPSEVVREFKRMVEESDRVAAASSTSSDSGVDVKCEG